MADSNVNRVRQKERFNRNKAAFEEVFGNPFVKPEPLQGHYQRFQSRRDSIKAIQYGDDPAATPNPCTPSVVDFICDIDRTILNVLGTKAEVSKFQKTYFLDDDKVYTPKQREHIEQEVGAALLKLKLSPVLGYFRAERKPGAMTRK